MVDVASNFDPSPERTNGSSQVGSLQLEWDFVLALLEQHWTFLSSIQQVIKFQFSLKTNSDKDDWLFQNDRGDETFYKNELGKLNRIRTDRFILEQCAFSSLRLVSEQLNVIAWSFFCGSFSSFEFSNLVLATISATLLLPFLNAFVPRTMLLYQSVRPTTSTTAHTYRYSYIPNNKGASK